jgi:hypothetical protein
MAVKSRKLKIVAYVANEGSMRNKDRILQKFLKESYLGGQGSHLIKKYIVWLTWFRIGKVECRTVLNNVINIPVLYKARKFFKI